ncbi:PucR family transcriptional regulator [Enterococcus sp. LJL98]
MNVTTFLTLPFTKDFKLLAGKSGGTNNITGVNILDNPKAADWLTPGELIVTSGYFFKETPQAMADFLAHFDRLNIAGICIKPQVYLTPLPPELLRECNERGIPLIEIPYGMAFSKILNTVMNLLSSKANEANQLALDLSSKFLEYGLQGKSIAQLKEKLEALLGNPVLITSNDWHLLTPVVDEAFSPYLLADQHQKTFDVDAFQSLPGQFQTLKHPSIFLLQDQTSGVILPVFFNEITYGYLIVLQTRKELTRQDYLALEHMALTVALEIVHQNEKNRIQNKVRRDFYRELLFGNHSIEELNAFNIEFNYEIPYTVFIVAFEVANDQSQSLVQQKYAEEKAIRKSLSAAQFFQHPTYPTIHIFKQAEAFIGLVGRAPTDTAKEDEREKQFFQDFHQYLFTSLPPHSCLNVFVGTKQPIENIKQSYREAKQMMAYQQRQQSQVYFAKDYYFELFLRQQVPNEVAQEFITHYLAPLQGTSGKKGDLLETLRAYLHYQLNLAETSRALFIHRNTLLYRLEKIEGLLGYSLETAKHILPLQLAMAFLQEYPEES